MTRIFIYCLIGFAAIGLGYQLFVNPTTIIKTISIFVFSGIVLYILARIIFARQGNNAEMRKYKQAVRQSQLKYQKSATKPRQPKQRKPLRRRASHLRVIDGRKPK